MMMMSSEPDEERRCVITIVVVVRPSPVHPIAGTTISLGDTNEGVEKRRGGFVVVAGNADGGGVRVRRNGLSGAQLLASPAPLALREQGGGEAGAAATGGRESRGGGREGVEA